MWVTMPCLISTYLYISKFLCVWPCLHSLAPVVKQGREHKPLYPESPQSQPLEVHAPPPPPTPTPATSSPERCQLPVPSLLLCSVELLLLLSHNHISTDITIIHLHNYLQMQQIIPIFSHILPNCLLTLKLHVTIHSNMAHYHTAAAAKHC